MSVLGWVLHFLILGAQTFVAVLQWKTVKRLNGSK